MPRHLPPQRKPSHAKPLPPLKRPIAKRAPAELALSSTGRTAVPHVLLAQLTASDDDAAVAERLAALIRECLESCEGRRTSGGSLGSMLRERATRSAWLASSGVKSISAFMKSRWGSLEGFVQAHASKGLVLRADGLIALSDATAEEDPMRAPAWTHALAAEKPAPSREMVEELASETARQLSDFQ
ncbi:hypothetical protein AB1Y20_000116 [Prymnesium parvum]|uniref:Uncharacterized protein n=1 Tax=Prymnesium parvum TaxID=97485 RepID=A0AB34K7J6_PRYPA